MFDLSFYANKKVLITGHTGFKGAWLCKILSNAGENVADLFYWISYNFIGLLIFAAIAFCLIKFRPFTKLFKKIFKKN